MARVFVVLTGETLTTLSRPTTGVILREAPVAAKRGALRGSVIKVKIEISFFIGPLSQFSQRSFRRLKLPEYFLLVAINLSVCVDERVINRVLSVDLACHTLARHNPLIAMGCKKRAIVGSSLDTATTENGAKIVITGATIGDSALLDIAL
jgi:hypothetical protein